MSAEDEARAVAERFDSRVPDGPEAADSPHVPPRRPEERPAVETTNDFDLELSEEGDFTVHMHDADAPGLDWQISFRSGVRLAAWIVYLADRSGSAHDFEAVLDALYRLD